MGNIILHSTPLPELRAMIGDIIEEKLKNFQPTNVSPSQTKGEYLSRKEVCKLLKISLATLHYWSKDGILQGYRIGGRVLYRQTEITAALDNISAFKGKHHKGI